MFFIILYIKFRLNSFRIILYCVSPRSSVSIPAGFKWLSHILWNFNAKFLGFSWIITSSMLWLYDLDYETSMEPTVLIWDHESTYLWQNNLIIQEGQTLSIILYTLIMYSYSFNIYKYIIFWLSSLVTISHTSPKYHHHGKHPLRSSFGKLFYPSSIWYNIHHQHMNMCVLWWY